MTFVTLKTVVGQICGGDDWFGEKTRNRPSGSGARGRSSEAIRAYKELLVLLPEDQRAVLAELLAAKDVRGTPGLYIALKNGHLDATVAYRDLLNLLEDGERDRLIEILSIKDPRSAPWLYEMLGEESERGDIVRNTYGKLIKFPCSNIALILIEYLLMLFSHETLAE